MHYCIIYFCKYINFLIPLQPFNFPNFIPFPANMTARRPDMLMAHTQKPLCCRGFVVGSGWLNQPSRRSRCRSRPSRVIRLGSVSDLGKDTCITYSPRGPVPLKEVPDWLVNIGQFNVKFSS
jgi:hypothetical protein